jgi:acyl-CoA thioesterase II
MAAMVARGLSDRLTVKQVGSDRFEGRGADVPARIYGGEVAAQAVASANLTVGEDRLAHSVQCTYLRGGDPDDAVTYDVERIRDGRGFSTRGVKASQGGIEIFRATVGYYVPDDGIQHEVAMPEVPAPESLPTLADALDAEGRAWSDWQAWHPEFEIRAVPPDLADPTGRRQFWCRFLIDEPDEPKRQSVLGVYSSDFTMVSSIRMPHEPRDRKTLFMTSLNHTLFLHRPYLASGWHLVDHYSPVAFGGRGISIAHTFTPDGTLVASAVQEGLARPQSQS